MFIRSSYSLDSLDTCWKPKMQTGATAFTAHQHFLHLNIHNPKPKNKNRVPRASVWDTTGLQRGGFGWKLSVSRIKMANNSPFSGVSPFRHVVFKSISIHQPVTPIKHVPVPKRKQIQNDATRAASAMVKTKQKHLESTESAVIKLNSAFTEQTTLLINNSKCSPRK